MKLPKLLSSVLVTVLAFGLATTAVADNGISSDGILLGQSCALKGPAKALGHGMKTGLNVYFDGVNAKGGIHGRKIKLKTINDGYEPKKCIKATRMLIDRQKVFLMIGEVGTPTSKVAVPICEENEVPFVGPFTGAEFLRNPFKKWVVNVRGSYYQEMERLAQYLVDQKGLKRVACFYQDDSYGRAGLRGIELALERRGMKLASTGTYKRNTVAVAGGLEDIARGRPDAVVMVGAYTGCAALIKAGKRHPVTKNAVYCNVSFVGTKALLQELGDASEGCIVSQVVPFPWDTSVPVVAEFHAAMKAAGKEKDIGFITLEGYMGGKLFSMVMEGVEGEPTREKFLAEFSRRKDFDLGGIVLSYGPDDHQGMDEIFLTVFRGDRVVPLTAATATFSNR